MNTLATNNWHPYANPFIIELRSGKRIIINDLLITEAFVYILSGFTVSWKRNRLRWFGHVERKGDDDWVKRCTRLKVVGKRPRGRPRKMWMTALKDDMRRGALSPEDARNRGLWRRIHGAKQLTWVNLKVLFHLFVVP
jgi:hypothetical protein